MCGIAGYIASQVADQTPLKKMTDAIIHRGPDGEGQYYAPDFALGHRRLAIVDLSEAAAQPMHYLDRYVITYNGEVYNHPELREELTRRGYTFNSESDTEVILASYDCWGVDCLNKFNGMRAFVLYDKQEQQYFIVSLYGQCADFDAINAIANKHGIPVIEDAAQSFGATYKGKQSCNLSTVSCTSFFPSKPLGCYGDGGAIFTNDDELAIVLRQIARHGQDRRYHHVRVGVNSRLDTLQAAILLPKLEIFAEEIQLRQQVAARYQAKFAELSDSHRTTQNHTEPHRKKLQTVL